MAVAFAVDARVDLAAATVLTLFAVVGDLASSRLAAKVVISGTGLAMYVAATRYGAFDAVVVVIVGQLVAYAISPYRRVALVANLAAFALPVVLAAVVASGIAGPHANDLTWLAAGIAATIAGETLNLVVGGLLVSVYDGLSPVAIVRSFVQVLPSFAYEAVFVGVVAVADIESPAVAISLGVLLIAAHLYMGRLVSRAYAQSVLAQQRAQRLGELSLGVLSSLVNTLNARDPRAARHLAGVARYARDLARQIGLSEQQQDVAHTAGLLHDIGRFALSDRVLNAESLTAADWEQIYEHPERGAELVKDLDSYGPIAEIVVAHHERIDGHGYPFGLKAGEIPLLARVIAICETYDTLTAPDTYRSPPLSSFEALRELRAVAGKQLDAELVESFATMLAGTDAGYRHADDVDYAAELDVQRSVLDRIAGPAPLA
jgi:putative nucleotidyltransferase with HDIG domain